MIPAAAEKYTYRIEWNEDISGFIGRCLEFPSLTADGDSPGEALSQIRALVGEGIGILSQDGDEVPEPLTKKNYKGKIPLRVPPETHRRLAIAAAEQGVSLNQYITSALESSAGLDGVNATLSALVRSLSALTARMVAIENRMVTTIAPVFPGVPRESTWVSAWSPFYSAKIGVQRSPEEVQLHTLGQASTRFALTDIFDQCEESQETKLLAELGR